MKYKKINQNGLEIPVIGQGTGRIGGDLSKDTTDDDRNIIALKLGIELGMTFIDTAESYGSGHTEELVGEAIRGIRNKVFIATKFSPEHHSYNDVLKAAENSLKRLKTDYIDLYQVHWPNPTVPIKETMQAMEKLVEQGKIKYIGVSNFSLEQLKEAQKALTNNKIFSLQIEYNLLDRFIENKILPYCKKENIMIIAYSPLDQGKIAPNKQNTLQTIATKYKKTISQIALNWLIKNHNIIVIPKATNEEHIRKNASSADFELSEEDFNEIDNLYNKKPILVEVNKIHVSTKGECNRKVYQTLKQALANELCFVPSPLDLSQYIKNHPREEIKPVRLIINKNGEYEYSLVEGRVRYWAWVIAHKGRKLIPAYIRT